MDKNEFVAMVERALITTDCDALFAYLNVLSHKDLVDLSFALIVRIQTTGAKRFFE